MLQVFNEIKNLEYIQWDICGTINFAEIVFFYVKENQSQ